MPASRKADQVYTQIRHEIELGALQPGQRMSEVWLVEHTGASRTPVRDALRRLAADELVILEPRQAPMVAPLSIQAIKDLFEFRRIIEIATVESIAQRTVNEPSLKQKFELLSLKFLHLDREVTDFLTQFTDLTSAFDELISQHANNRFLEKSIAGLQPHTTRLRVIAHSDDDRLQQSVQEHINMCTAIATGDSDAAAHFCRQHLIHVEQSILKSLVTGDFGAVNLQA
ncbi:transcriptional regulator [Corynebacterium deserti GIMN1.010]|uniref:Transcriptional regulator n=1 Tax=Corynebacterium deserti GIMN1.010 TaxID=931089 RepID=A0A0M4CNJ8_9CORY|nr:GntR family transcriptional regulator [Corynebacterium deserti]ALC05130.1 transcriptional regulator [Corynebacterium deserti GIMN1.010]